MKKAIVFALLSLFLFSGYPALAQAPTTHHPESQPAAAGETSTAEKQPAHGTGPGMMHGKKGMMMMKSGMMEMMHGGPKGNMMEGGMMGMMMKHMMSSGRHGDMMMGPQKEKMMGWDLKHLNLTPEQWQQVRKLAFTHLEKLHALAAEEAKLQLENSYLLGEDKPDEAKITQNACKLGEARARMALTSRSYLDGLMGILNEEQQKRLDD